MKGETVYLCLQPKEENSYWADRILEGIRSGIKELGLKLFFLDPNHVLPEVRGRYVLVSGSRIDWLQTTVFLLLEKGAHPIIVNACMLPFRSLRCSGVVFELEEILESCLNALKEKGKKRVALLGVRRDSASDHAKVSAFESSFASFEKQEILWAEKDVANCVSLFSESLAKEKYDAVICANDTVAVHLLKEHPLSGVDVIGIGNSYLGAGIGLSSICFDYYEMGKAGVSLYQILSAKKENCHVIVSLPCYFENRNSARLSLCSSPAAAKQTASENQDYFRHPDVENMIRIEAIFQSGDEVDRAILYGIARGESVEKISSKLYFSDRAIRYRLTKLVKRYGFSGRGELEETLKQVFFLKNK